MRNEQTLWSANDVLTEQGKEAIANSFLHENHALGKAQGCYTTDQMDRQRWNRHEYSLDEDRARQVCTNCFDGIIWRSIQQSLQRANCPYLTQECMRLWCMRFTYREIADMEHIQLTHSSVGYHVRKAVTALRQDHTLGIIELLAEVFHMPPSQITYLLNKPT